MVSFILINCLFFTVVRDEYGIEYAIGTGNRNGVGSGVIDLEIDFHNGIFFENYKNFIFEKIIKVLLFL